MPGRPNDGMEERVFQFGEGGELVMVIECKFSKHIRGYPVALRVRNMPRDPKLYNILGSNPRNFHHVHALAV